MKGIRTIFGVAFFMVILTGLSANIYAADIQAQLNAAGDCFDVEQPADTDLFKACGDGSVTVPALNCTLNANGGTVTTNAAGQLLCLDDDVGVADCSDCDGNFVNEDQTNSITSPMITNGQVGSADINSAQVQERVAGNCNGQVMVGINQNGTVTCEPDDDTVVGGDNLGNHTATQNVDLAAFQLVGNGGANGVAITNTGNVGIGTAAPTGKLHVSAGANTDILIGKNSSNGNYNLISVNGTLADSLNIGMGGGATGDSNLYLNTPSGGDMWFRVDGVTGTNGAMVIKSGGNIGIGTTSPARKLHISDAMRLEPITNAPVSASQGDMYFDDSDALCVYVSAGWTKIAGSGSCS